MILRTLKSNRSINLVLLPLAGISLWAKSLLEPFSYSYYPGESQNVLFAPIDEITKQHTWLQVLLSLVLVIFTGFLIQQVNDRFAFIKVRTKLPATMLVILIGGFVNMHTLHPVFFAGIFLVLPFIACLQSSIVQMLSHKFLTPVFFLELARYSILTWLY